MGLIKATNIMGPSKVCPKYTQNVSGEIDYQYFFLLLCVIDGQHEIMIYTKTDTHHWLAEILQNKHEILALDCDF